MENLRKVGLMDGTGMGGVLYIFDTDAPAEELKMLEHKSCKIYATGGGEDDIPIWRKVLKKKGYTFKCIDEHRNVTPYGTSTEWQEKEYPGIEVYVIEDQPDCAKAKLIMSFKVGDKAYDFWGEDFEVEITDYERISVYAENLRMFCNDILVEGSLGTTFQGYQINPEDALEQTVFGYLMRDKTYSFDYVCNELDAMMKEETFAEMVSVGEKTYPKHAITYNQIVDLVWVGKTSLYYAKDEYVVLIDPKTMSTQTDIEAFVTSGLLQMLEDPTEEIVVIDKEFSPKMFAVGYDAELKCTVKSVPVMGKQLSKDRQPIRESCRKD